MATRSTSETGHGKNAANFTKLAATAESFGAKYNPAATDLKVASMKTQSTAINSAVADDRDGSAGFKTDANERRAMFKELPTRIRRTVNSLASFGVDDKAVTDMKAILKKIAGSGKQKAPKAEATPAVATKETISTSQKSYDSLVEHTRNAATYLGKVSEYKPNESELTVSAISTFANELEAINNKVVASGNKMLSGRAKRDELLYASKKGAVDITKRVKEYVKSVFGAKSPEYKAISKIDLRNYGKKWSIIAVKDETATVKGANSTVKEKARLVKEQSGVGNLLSAVVKEVSAAGIVRTGFVIVVSAFVKEVVGVVKVVSGTVKEQVGVVKMLSGVVKVTSGIVTMANG